MKNIKRTNLFSTTVEAKSYFIATSIVNKKKKETNDRKHNVDEKYVTMPKLSVDGKNDVLKVKESSHRVHVPL